VKEYVSLVVKGLFCQSLLFGKSLVFRGESLIFRGESLVFGEGVSQSPSEKVSFVGLFYSVNTRVFCIRGLFCQTFSSKSFFPRMFFPTTTNSLCRVVIWYKQIWSVFNRTVKKMDFFFERVFTSYNLCAYVYDWCVYVYIYIMYMYMYKYTHVHVIQKKSVAAFEMGVYMYTYIYFESI